MTWRDELAGCFDNLERLFAFHAMNEDRAFALLARLRSEGVGWRELSDEMRRLLDGDGATALQTEQALSHVEARFRPWLKDDGDVAPIQPRLGD